MGGTIRPLRNRPLTTLETSVQCFKTIIDDYYMNGLVVVDFYPNTAANGYNIYSFGYGSLATLIKVIPPAIPVYLTYTLPTSTSTQSFTNNAYQWDYLNYASGNTQFTTFI